MNIIDSHFHLLLIKQKGIDIDKLMESLSAMGFVGGLDIGIDADDLTERYELLRKYPSLLYAAGMYPSHAESSAVDDELETLEQHIQRYKPHALGEIGLDYHWDYATPKRQQALFIEQIKLANKYSLPVVIHNREADYDILRLLQEHKPSYGLILHCYSSGDESLSDFLRLGSYISFAGNVTYKQNKAMHRAAILVDHNKLLIETDSPYLAPIPKRGKINTPAFIPYTYRYVAEIREEPEETLVETVYKNFTTLFPLAAL